YIELAVSLTDAPSKPTRERIPSEKIRMAIRLSSKTDPRCIEFDTRLGIPFIICTLARYLPAKISDRTFLPNLQHRRSTQAAELPPMQHSLHRCVQCRCRYL